MTNHTPLNENISIVECELIYIVSNASFPYARGYSTWIDDYDQMVCNRVQGFIGLLNGYQNYNTGLYNDNIHPYMAKPTLMTHYATYSNHGS